jgi:membrane associated rhomboid family serine protease
MTEPERPRTAVPLTPAIAPGQPRAERAFNAPWIVLATSAVLVAAFLWQLSLGLNESIARFGFVPIALSAGRPGTVFSHIFLHGGWLHLILNATALLAFGAPVARIYGGGLPGALRFVALFVACGLLGGLVFWALHPTGGVPLVGASGAISGLMGGAARLVERQGVIGGAFSPVALRFLLPWVVLNLIIAAAGMALGPALPIAWEAHLGGLFAGLFLVGALAPRRPAAAPIPRPFDPVG